MGLTIKDVLQLIEKMATSSLQWFNEGVTPKKHFEIHEVDGIIMVNAILDFLTKKIDKLNIKVVNMSSYEMCGLRHTIGF